MALRRTRIKGVLNIPPRKKPNLELKLEDVKKEDRECEEHVGTTEPEQNPQDSQPVNEELQPITSVNVESALNAGEVKDSIEDNNSKTNAEKVVILSEVRICTKTNQMAQPPTSSDSSPSREYSNHFQGREPLFSPTSKRFSTDCSDVEYPIPPASPSKFNRARIKAVPKWNYKKGSYASESEDEGKKYGRMRNNSVCSVASTVYPEPSTPSVESLINKEHTVSTPKKLMRTDQSRKLAEARREFYKKFGSAMPVKQQLKMIDLIFYNPSSNPMSKSSEPIDESNDANCMEREEQDADDLVEEEDIENDLLPVPQIKIGPSGEIVLDEATLVIENTNIARQKELQKKTKVINADHYPSGYGIYKKSKRSVGWSQKETIRFYKTLNLIGTDFTTMQQLFPKRNRRELKRKFNREERLNGALIDKVIKQPCNYNFEQLKSELEIEQQEEELLLKIRKEELEKNKKVREEKKNTKHKTMDQESSLPLKKRPVMEETRRRKSTRKSSSLSIKDLMDDDSDADESDISQSDGEEVIPILKPTRSGRIPKSTLFASPVLNSLREARKRRLSSASSVDSEKLVPGSVVITTDENGDDQNNKEFKVFMVTPQKNLTLLELDSEIIARLVNEKESKGISNLSENNVTIAAAEQE